jgi:hypothetical protein
MAEAVRVVEVPLVILDGEEGKIGGGIGGERLERETRGRGRIWRGNQEAVEARGRNYDEKSESTVLKTERTLWMMLFVSPVLIKQICPSTVQARPTLSSPFSCLRKAKVGGVRSSERRRRFWNWALSASERRGMASFFIMKMMDLMEEDTRCTMMGGGGDEVEGLPRR